MPKLYEYFGLVIYFYSDDHLPIHIHVDGPSGSCKVELIVKDGKVVDVIFKRLGNQPTLSPSDKNKLKELLKHFSQDIVEKWEAYNIEKKRFKPLIITKKLK